MSPGTYNVVVIVLDDVGCDKLGVYGQSPSQSPSEVAAGLGHQYEQFPLLPNIDSLAAGGTRFTNCYANPMCSPTRATIQTGRYSFRTGVHNQIAHDALWANGSLYGGSPYALPTTEVSIATHLKSASSYSAPPAIPYRCGAFGKWHLTSADPVFGCHPIDFGYDSFQGMLGNNDLPGLSHTQWLRYDAQTPTSSSGACGASPTAAGRWSATVTRDDAVGFIRQATTDEVPFFAYVCFNPPHNPVQVPSDLSTVSQQTRDRLTRARLATGFDFDQPGKVLPPINTFCTCGPCGGLGPTMNWPTPPADCHELRRLYRMVYRAMLESVDHEIGVLLEQLPANTMVILVGDNGTADNFLQAYGCRSRAVQGSSQPVGAVSCRCGTGLCGCERPLPSACAPFPDLHGKRSVYQLGIRVPLIVWGPHASPNGVSDAPINTTDLFSTIAELAGAIPPTSCLQDSVSFVPLLTNPLGPATREFAFAEWAATLGMTIPLSQQQSACLPGAQTPASPQVSGVYSRALTNGHVKLIRRSEPTSTTPLPTCAFGASSCTVECGPVPGVSYFEELYDLDADPNEVQPIDPTNLPASIPSALYGRMVREMARLSGS